MMTRLFSLALITLLLTTAPALLYAQQTARGVVYLDANENGRHDEGEEGIAGVGVSNGRQVVQTDDAGRYRLPVGDDATLFVIKPSGYRLPLNELNQPCFYYTHKPQGSPELNYAGVEPTGPLPDSVNFGLLPGGTGASFNILVFGDPQPYTIEEVGYFERDIVESLLDAQGYAFGISLGDLVGDDLDLFAPYNAAVARVGLPWFNVYGNHDMNFDASADSLADDTFERVFGPATYSFNEGEVHFIVLDDVVYPRSDGESGYIGGFTDRQLAFLENDLRHVPTDKLIVLAMHIPLFMPENWGRTFRAGDREALFALLADYPHTVSLSAHTHLQRVEFMDSDDGWKRDDPHVHYNVGTTSGDWWSGVPGEGDIPPTTMRDGTPNGYAALRFDGSDFVFDYTPTRQDSARHMSLWGPEVVPQDSWHGAQLYVNYYLGSDSTRVRYRVDGEGAWRKMQRVREADPHIAALRHQWDRAERVLPGRRPSNPAHSTHLWKAGVPNNLPLGEHTIHIQVTDMFGRTFTDQFTYKVVKPAGADQNQ